MKYNNSCIKSFFISKQNISDSEIEEINALNSKENRKVSGNDIINAFKILESRLDLNIKGEIN